ncbi:phage tail protein [Escherichia coli]|uniref:phage tail protein n=1 Tax=Escherichia coli TaxID=562 RepID=UPI000BE18AC1|nr:phage tail protein [Escherichia coli]
MANLPETPQWEDGIYQIEVSDPVLGGPDGISNRQGKQLASRTLYLKQQVEKGGTDLAKHIAAADPHTQYAPKASPTFTGTPTAPTPANSDNSKKLATTEFVAKALAALAGSAPETLDTLKELADALGNDPNFATTVLNKLAEKLAKDQNGADIPDPALFVKNLGLGESAKMPAATALASSAGNIAIPVLIGGVQRTALLQWKMVSVPQSADGNMVVVDDSWPVAFPNACLSINPSLSSSLIYATSGAPFVSAAIVDRVKFKAACAYTKSNSTVTVWGVGY